ncbi:MAG: ribose 5-phosphate isomerase B [Rickettsiales bacterium]|nr:ribose 5-phosphate isomerase B [Rickettsiales bacterium]OUV79192.1 MAG: ribose 5-phosphate isomerase B [Rickettsiales bacterium TMED131]
MDNVKEKIAITSDHAGFHLKEKIKTNLEGFGYGVLDLGTDSEDSVDYPDYGKAIAQNIIEGNVKKGIALCGTGIGISISANRFKGIRAALCSDYEMAIQARKHNNANILAIGARNMDYKCASKCVEAFLNTDFEGERHIRRVEKIEKNLKESLDIDLEIALEKELNRQKNTIELIASENFASENVMKYQGSVLTNKYAEGYPGKRYYGGCEFVDIAENLAINRLKDLFGCKWANVQPNSGSQANQAVFLALLSPGDTILGMSLSAGGHLTHGAIPNQSGKYFNSIQYGVKKENGQIDYDEVRDLSRKHKPKMIIAGASAYSSKIDFKLFRNIADEVGAYLLVDMAHYSGLIASKVYPDPLPYADVCTSTTHKTLRGPRGGIIISNNQELGKLIDKAVFPGLQGGPLMHVIAAKAAAFKEALSEDFRKYSQQTLLNAKAICGSLKENGFNIISGDTSCHMLLVDLSNKSVTGKLAEESLDNAGITCNKNAIPFDDKSPFITSGIRIGSAAGTTRGFKEKEFIYIGSLINDVIDSLKNTEQDINQTAEVTRNKVLELCKNFPLY